MQNCRARLEANPLDYPKKAPKKPKPVRTAYAFWLTDKTGAVLLRRRPEKGLLGGMMEIPTSEWREGDTSKTQAMRAAPSDALWKELDGTIRHTFTHFHLDIKVLTGKLMRNPAVTGQFVALENFEEYALPTLMKKIVSHVLAAK